MSTRGWETVTPQDVTQRALKQATMPQKRRSKYHATPTTVNGFRFDSAKEASRYRELLILGMEGHLRNLELQPRFVLKVTCWDAPVTRIVGSYFADFMYEERTVITQPFGVDIHWYPVVEDVKGMKTPIYRLKKKMVEAQYGIEIREI